MSKDNLIKRECIYCENGIREEIMRKSEPHYSAFGTVTVKLVVFNSKCCGGGRSIMPLSLAEKGALNAN